MSALRQAYLDGSSTNVLTVIHPAPFPVHGEPPTRNVPMSEPATESSMLKLPEELLALIIELVAEINNSEDCGLNAHRQLYRDLKILSLVCRRFSRIAQPLLFRTVSFDAPIETVPPSRLVRKYHTVLKENPRFRGYCRALHIHIPDIGGSGDNPPHKYGVASDFARLLTGLRFLSFHGGFGNMEHPSRNAETWALLHLFATNCRDMNYVQIHREGWGINLPLIFENMAIFPSLRTLSVYGISRVEVGRVDLEHEKLRTSPITSLKLLDYEEGPEATRLLIQWPAKLTHFEFGSFYDNRHTMDYPMFESWLLIHKDTLTHIEMGYLSRDGSDRFLNATLFPNLEFLSLSRWQMDQNDVEFRDDHAIILGPSLKTFSWNFNIYDQHAESWTAFGDAEYEWIRNLVKVAAARKSVLKTIQIQFLPDRYYSADQFREMGYPWDLMDKFRDEELAPKGFNLVYNEPTLTKKEWLEACNPPKEENDTVEDALEHRRTDDDTDSDEQEVCEAVYQGEDIRKYVNSLSHN